MTLPPTLIEAMARAHEDAERARFGLPALTDAEWATMRDTLLPAMTAAVALIPEPPRRLGVEDVARLVDPDHWANVDAGASFADFPLLKMAIDNSLDAARAICALQDGEG